MSKAIDQSLLETLPDSWARNNTIMLNLLQTLPESSLGVRATEDSPTVAASFMHVNYIRLVHVFEDAPEFARDVPAEERRKSEKFQAKGENYGTFNARAILRPLARTPPFNDSHP